MAAQKFAGHKHIINLSLKFFHRMIDILHGNTIDYISKMVECLIYPNCQIEDITNIIKLLSRLFTVPLLHDNRSKIQDFVVQILPGLCNEVFSKLGDDWDTIRTLKSREVTVSAELREKEELEYVFFEFLSKCLASDIKILKLTGSEVASLIVDQLAKVIIIHNSNF